MSLEYFFVKNHVSLDNFFVKNHVSLEFFFAKNFFLIYIQEFFFDIYSRILF